MMNLDQDDRQWIGELLQRQEEGVTKHLDARIGALEERVIKHLEERVIKYVDARIEALEARVYERIERVETNLLTEFHKWASPTEARLRTHTATLRALDLEMESLDERIRKLEGGSSPPA